METGATRQLLLVLTGAVTRIGQTAIAVVCDEGVRWIIGLLALPVAQQVHARVRQLRTRERVAGLAFVALCAAVYVAVSVRAAEQLVAEEDAQGAPAASTAAAEPVATAKGPKWARALTAAFNRTRVAAAVRAVPLGQIAWSLVILLVLDFTNVAVAIDRADVLVGLFGRIVALGKRAAGPARRALHACARGVHAFRRAQARVPI